MAEAQPWMKFHPQDWRADEKLRLCSLAARGLWIEMLAIMHRSERYGQLLIAGIVPTDAQIAVQVGASVDEVAATLAELEQAGVFSRAATGAIYSRRMTRDHKKAKTARKNGLRGGNPTLGKQRENPASVKGEDKPQDKGGLKLRGQRPDRNLSVSARGSSLPDGWRPDSFGDGSRCRQIVDGWGADGLDRQVERFTAHHVAKGTRSKDWQASWKTWVLNSEDFAPRPTTSRPAAASVPLYLHLAEQEDRRTATAAGRG